MKNLKQTIALVFIASIISCDSNKRNPELQYMPDMYESVPYNSNDSKFNNINTEPVVGTIARGKHPAYNIPNTNEGYELAKATLKNPLKMTKENLSNGKAMYKIYCATCHGNKGDGNGVLSQREKFTGIPSYADRDITSGSIYHVIMHGRNLMGSHSSQITYKERWQVVQYVKKLRKDLTK